MHKNSGFTLIEIMMTVVVFSIGAVFIGRAFNQSIGAIKHSDEVLNNAFVLQRAAVQIFLHGDADQNQEDSVRIEHREFKREAVELDQYTLEAKSQGSFANRSAMLVFKPTPETLIQKEK